MSGFKRWKQFINRWYSSRHNSDLKNSGALSNLRVLDLTRIVAGPYCTMILGDMGADVIKVENPHGGDESRKWGPPFVGNTSESCYFLSVNRNKRSMCVDFKKPEGIKIIKDLAKECDVLVENFVPGVLDNLGLGYDDISKVAPKIVYCSLTGYGSVGPYKKRPGYDVIAASIGGLMHITGPAGGEPCKVGVAVTDMAAGLYAHGAILAGLLNRIKTNKGQKIDCNLLSTQLAGLINIGSNYLNAEIDGKRWGSAHPSIVPYKSYKTFDDRFITIGTGSDKQFYDLCSRLNILNLAHQFETNELRVQNRELVDRDIQRQLQKKTLATWLDILNGASFPYGPVNNLEEAFSDDHVQAIQLVKEIEHPVAGKIKMVGPPVEFNGCVSEIRRPPPTLGQHTTDILSAVLGYSDGQIKALIKNKVIA